MMSGGGKIMIIISLFFFFLIFLQGKWAHIGGEYQECEVELIATNEVTTHICTYLYNLLPDPHPSTQKHQINHRQPPQSSLPLKLEPLTPTNLVAKMSIVNKKRELVSFSFFDCAWIAAGCPLVVSLSFSTLPSVAPSEKWGGLGVVGTFTNPHCKMTRLVVVGGGRDGCLLCSFFTHTYTNAYTVKEKMTIYFGCFWITLKHIKDVIFMWPGKVILFLHFFC